MLYDATADFSCSDCLSLSQTQKLHVLKRGEIVSHAVETLFVVRLGTCLPVFLTFTLCSHSHNNHLPWTPPLWSHIPPPPPATPPSAVTEHDPPPPPLQPSVSYDPGPSFFPPHTLKHQPPLLPTTHFPAPVRPSFSLCQRHSTNTHADQHSMFHQYLFWRFRLHFSLLQFLHSLRVSATYSRQTWWPNRKLHNRAVLHTAEQSIWDQLDVQS